MGKYGRIERSWLIGTSGVLITTEVSIAIYASAQPDRRVTVFATSTILALAAASVGALLGFIFAIPKVVAGDRSPISAITTADAYRSNTNLEQVSDWLTKLLIGAALVQLAAIGRAFDVIAQRLAQYLGPGAEVLVPAIVIIFAAGAFLISYLWTRLYLLRQLSEADGQADPQFYVSMMNAYLYVHPPVGFSRVIELGERLQTDLGHEARYWRYLAYAYGQKYAWLDRVGGATNAELQSLRRAALEAAKRGLAIDPSLAPRMRQIWRPAPGASDDDLAIFRHDVEFEALFESYR